MVCKMFFMMRILLGILLDTNSTILIFGETMESCIPEFKEQFHIFLKNLKKLAERSEAKSSKLSFASKKYFGILTRSFASLRSAISSETVNLNVKLEKSYFRGGAEYRFLRAHFVYANRMHVHSGRFGHLDAGFFRRNDQLPSDDVSDDDCLPRRSLKFRADFQRYQHRATTANYVHDYRSRKCSCSYYHQ